MTDAVVELFPGASVALRQTERIDPASILDCAMKAGLSQVAVVGRTPTGEMYIAGSDCADMTIGLLVRGMNRLAHADDLGTFSEEAG